jgi:hypothetical protein
MAHTISLGAAIVFVLLALLLWWLIGPLALIILIVAAVLFWYAFGPGAGRIVIN